MAPDSGSLEAFRAAVRAFLTQNLPEDMARRNLGANYSSREDTLAWTGVLAQRGWSAPHWPKEYGGTGWSPLQRHVFAEESFLAGAPLPNIQAMSLVGPVIYTFGAAEQQARFLPDILEGRVFWAQGFSEPEAGSDLASLRTSAVRDGDDYVVNGQKIWTTQADIADMLFCLVRTSTAGKPQTGITFLLIYKNAPGVTIRPIGSIDGQSHLFETFFSDVRVPVRNRIGEEGHGWTYAKFLLGLERMSVAELPRNRFNFLQLKALAAESRACGRTVDEAPEFASRMARLEMDLMALEASVLEGLRTPNDDALTASAIKIRGTELLQAVAQARVECVGGEAAVVAASPKSAQGSTAAAAMSDMLYLRAATIYGGATEIQKNIIGRGVLMRDAASVRPGESEEQRMLRDSARRLAEIAGDAADSGDLRRRFAEAGWLGLAVAESEGGFGMSTAEACVLAEELASQLIVQPSLAAHAFGVEVLKAAGTPGAMALLSRSSVGKALVAVAYDEPEARGGADWLATVADARGDEWRINGRKQLVLDGADATHLVVWARTTGATGLVSAGEGALFLVERSRMGVETAPRQLIDGRYVADVALTDVAVTPDDVLGAVGAGLPLLTHALEHATVIACAEALGLMGGALWMTRDYLTVRKQFGQRLADFQALQHRLADMFVQIEQARAITAAASEALGDADARKRSRLVNAAKATVGRVAKFVGAQSIQLHGGIGMTSEYGIGRYYKALLTIDALFGTEPDHIARFCSRQS
jgi:acyl-CoA dehydrogenase